MPAAAVDQQTTDPGSLADQIRIEVRVAIAASGLTQAAVARRIGCSQKHVSAMLSGKTRLAIDWADKITQVCGRQLVILSMSRAASGSAFAPTRGARCG